MPYRDFVQIGGVVAILAAGQLLFRKAALSTPPLATVDGLFRLIRNPVFLVALFLYGVATLLWVGVLQRVPLSRAYPFMALGFAVVPAAAILSGGEPLSLRLISGLVFVIVGLLIIGWEP